MEANLAECFRGLSSNFCCEKGKPREIYRKNVYEEAGFNKKKVITNGLNIGLPQQALVEKTVHKVEIH